MQNTAYQGLITFCTGVEGYSGIQDLSFQVEGSMKDKRENLSCKTVIFISSMTRRVLFTKVIIATGHVRAGR